MTSDPSAESALDQAARRLDQAIARLEQRMAERIAQAGASADGAVDQDRANLAAQLDAARARERELAEAGAQASEALGRAIEQVRSALNTQSATET